MSARGRFIFSACGRFIFSARAWLAAVCASELGTLLVFSNFSALLPILQKDWGVSNSEAGLIGWLVLPRGMAADPFSTA